MEEVEGGGGRGGGGGGKEGRGRKRKRKLNQFPQQICYRTHHWTLCKKLTCVMCCGWSCVRRREVRWRETLSKVEASWRRKRREALGDRIELPSEGKDGLGTLLSVDGLTALSHTCMARVTAMVCTVSWRSRGEPGSS